MKKMLFIFILLFLVACSETEEPTPTTQPATEAPAQNIDSDNGKEVESTPINEEESAALTDDEAMDIIRNLISNLREETENAGHDTTIEAIQQAWAPYVTTSFWDDASTSLDCDFVDYCGAFYNIPNSVDFGWQRTFDFSADDTFTTAALVPNIGDSVGLYSTLQSLEIKLEDSLWKFIKSILSRAISG